MNNSVSQELLKFLQKSPTAFHAVQQMKSELLAVDFTELKENQRWNIECGKHYFVTRNDSSLIAFTIPENGIDKMHIRELLYSFRYRDITKESIEDVQNEEYKRELDRLLKEKDILEDKIKDLINKVDKGETV